MKDAMKECEEMRSYSIWDKKDPKNLTIVTGDNVEAYDLYVPDCQSNPLVDFMSRIVS